MADNYILASGVKERPGYNYFNLFNPLSPLMGGGDRIPEWAMKLFPGSPVSAWLTAKSAAVGGTAALLAAAYRGLKNMNYMSEESQEDDPDKRILPQLGTTYSMDMAAGKPTRKERRRIRKAEKQQKKTAKVADIIPGKEVPVPSANPFSISDVATNTLYVGVPISAAILGASLIYAGVDKLSGSIRNQQLTKKVNRKNQVMKRLLQARARVAKGTITDQEVMDTLQAAEDTAPYVKTAKISMPYVLQKEKWRATLSAYGLLAAGLMVAAAGGSYQYFKKGDKNNVRFKAMRKGLEEYTKNKVAQSPINIVPKNQDPFFYAIDNGTAAAADKEDQEAEARNNAREDIEVHEPTKGISVTL